MDANEEEEEASRQLILRAFSAYRYQHLAANNLRRQSLATLPADHQRLLPDQKALLTASWLV